MIGGGCVVVMEEREVWIKGLGNVFEEVEGGGKVVFDVFVGDVRQGCMVER